MYIEKLPSGNYRYQMVYTEERTGKKKRASVTLPKNTDKAKREARSLLEEKIREINSDVIVSDVTFGELAESFLNVRRATLKPATHRRYVSELKTLCGALGADVRIDKLNARYVMTRFAASIDKGTTHNTMLSVFKTVMRWAYRYDYIDNVDWLKKLERVPTRTYKEKNAMKYLEREELQRLLPNLKVELNKLVIEFLALSGLRVGEALALEKSDVDIDNRIIHVTKTMDWRDHVAHEGAKTYASNREVYMQDELLELCKYIKAYMNKSAMACGFRSELFFCRFDGTAIPHCSLNQYFTYNTRKYIGRPLTLHSLRHTHTSLMFELGATLEAVSQRLGHADVRITRDIYLHITERKKAEYNAQFKELRLLN